MGGAQAHAKKKTPIFETAAAPAADAATREKERARRRRRAKAEMLGRGYEYMDLDEDTGQDPAGSPDDPHVTATASNRGAGTLGFAGTPRQETAGEAAGLTTLPGDAFGDGPREPMMPSTFGAGPIQPSLPQTWGGEPDEGSVTEEEP
jgi:PPE-repeat protein